MKVLQNIKPIDVEKERSERKRSISEFIESYNKNLPDRFPQATLENVTAFQKAHTSLFSGKNPWTLDRHRKKFMDWLPKN
jgi:hypothetical protein